MRIRFGLGVLLGILISGSAQAQQKCSWALLVNEQQNAMEQFALNKKMKTNAFNVRRGLVEYIEVLGPHFKKSIDKLNGRNRWLDSGAGEAKAQTDLLKLRMGSYTNKDYSMVPELTAIVYVKPASLLVPKTRFFKYLEGRLLEDIPNRELGQFELITDLFGPLSYSNHPEKVLIQYLELLKPGGKIFIKSVFVPKPGQLAETSILTRDGREISILQWLKELPGLRVTEIPSSKERIASVMLEIKSLSEIEIPELELLKIVEGAPPTRLYREK